MSNPFYTFLNRFVFGTKVRDTDMNAQFDAIEDGFDLVAPISSPAFTGTPTAPTAPTGTSSTQLATMEALANQAMAQVDLPAQVAGGQLESDGTDASFVVRTPTYTEFTSSGLWTPQDGSRFYRIERVGAGGGGGAGDVYYNGGGSGGEFVATQGLVSELTTPVSMIVGSGGLGAAHDGGATAGADGGNTSANGVTAYGGKGGPSGTLRRMAAAPRSTADTLSSDLEGLVVPHVGLGGPTPASTTSDGKTGSAAIDGGAGGGSGPSNSANVFGAGGVSENAGNGGDSAQYPDIAATDGEQPGGGGAGGWSTTLPASNGGDGIIRVWEW